MDQVLVLADLPVVLERSCHGVIYHLSGLVVTAFILDHLQLNLLLLLLALLVRLSLRGPHLHEVVDALPHEAIVVRLKQGIEVVGLSGQQSALVDNILLLTIDVFEVLRLIPDLIAFLLRLNLGLDHVQVVKEGALGPRERVEESREFFPGAPEVDVVFRLLLS